MRKLQSNSWHKYLQKPERITKPHYYLEYYTLCTICMSSAVELTLSRALQIYSIDYIPESIVDLLPPGGVSAPAPAWPFNALLGSIFLHQAVAQQRLQIEKTAKKNGKRIR